VSVFQDLTAIEIPQIMKNLKIEPATQGTSPVVSVVEISEPTSVSQSLEVIQQDVVKLESKPLRVRRVVIRLGSAVVLFHSTNLAVRTRTRLHADFVAFTAFGPQSVGAVNGLEVGPDRILMTRPDTEVEFVVAAGYESVAFLVPPEDLRTHLRDRQREEECPFGTSVSRGIELLTPGPADARRLYRWGRKLSKTAAQQPEILNLPQTQAVAQVELFENLLTTLGSVIQAELSPHDVTRQSHSQIVKLVQDYVVRHAAERLHITDLCEAAGVSERTLQYAFREVMGMTPVAYLTRLRLHRVRASLLAANPGTTTVTNEALCWGFWHFGDFSCAYKKCFGELPSETLRRRR